MTRRPRYTCSFCGRTQDDAWHMIAGPQPHAALICTACVHLCAPLLVDEQQEPTQDPLPDGPGAVPRPYP